MKLSKNKISSTLQESDPDYSYGEGHLESLREFLEKSRELYLIEEPINPYVENYLRSTDGTAAFENVLAYYRNLNSVEVLSLDTERLVSVYRLFLDEKGLNYNFKQKHALTTLYLLVRNYSDRGTVINMKFLYPLLKLCLGRLERSWSHIYFCSTDYMVTSFWRPQSQDEVSNKLAMELVALEFTTALLRFIGTYSKKPIPSLQAVANLVSYFSENVTESDEDPFPDKVLSLSSLREMKVLADLALENYLKELPEFLASEKGYSSPEDAERAFYLDAVDDNSDFLPYEFLSSFDEAFQTGAGATGEPAEKLIGAFISLAEMPGMIEGFIRELEGTVDSDMPEESRLIAVNTLWLQMSELDDETYLYRPDSDLGAVKI